MAPGRCRESNNPSYSVLSRVTASSTFITLLLPVFYAIFVLDLKILKWEEKEKKPALVVAVGGVGAD